MKKNVIFLISMIAVAVLLFMLDHTGLTTHIIVSVAGLLILVAYTISSKKTWKIPALEIIVRVCYAVALITGVVLARFSYANVFVIMHRVCALLFVLGLIVVQTHKLIKK